MPYPGNLTKELLGLKASRLADSLPQTAQEALFTISGGRIIVLTLIGEVTTVMGATPNNLSIIANPIVGADLPLSAVVASAADAVGTLYALPGAFATALVKGVAVPLASNPIILKPGSIDLLTSANNTGAAKWDLYWMPLDGGAKVVSTAI